MRAIHLQVLNRLRVYRNASVHSGEASVDEAEALLYQLKRYVERGLRFHLQNPFGFSSLEEAARFLDQNPDPDALNDKIARLRREIEEAELARGFHGQE